MLKKIFVIILAGAIFLNPGMLYALEALSLQGVIEETQRNNPDILAAKKRYEAAKARVPQAKSLEDPAIGLTFEKASHSPFNVKSTMPEDRMLSLSQFFPLFGKLSLKGKIALVESQMFASEYKNKELELINEVKNTYYDLFMNAKEIELGREILELLKSIASVAEAKYSVGEVSQEELYKIHAELARLNNDILNQEQEKLSKQTHLNTLLNRDPESPLGAPVLSEDVSYTNKDIRTLYQAALLNQPELAIFSYAIEKNKYAKSLAKRSFFPDLMAQITERGFSTGTIGPWDLMLAFTVPLWFWTKQRYEVKEAIANLEEAQAAYKAMQNRVFSEIKSLVAKIEIAKNKVNLNKNDLIPILESSIEVSLASFRSGKSDFMALLDSQRMLIQSKMDYYKALVEYNMNLADLERAVGSTVTSIPEEKK